MPIQLSRPLVYFDLETTGVDVARDRIIEISVAKHHPDGKVESKTRRFNPGVPIPKEATAVHGITDADVAGEPPFGSVARRLADFLEGCDLAGYNLVRFDLPLLEREFGRANVPFSIEDRRVVDVMQIFYKREPRDLAGACRFYLGRDHEGAHSAEADVAATADILGAMLGRYADLPRGLDELCGSLRDPDSLDYSGNIANKNGKPHLTFGKHSGKSLEWLTAHEPDYLRWMLEGTFLSDTKAIIRRHLEG